MNRLTISLDDDLYAMARAHAVATKTSLSKAISDLLRRRLSNPPSPSRSHSASEATSYFDPVIGIRVSRSNRPVTLEEIQQSMDDEDVRHLEAMGLYPENIKRGLNP